MQPSKINYDDLLDLVAYKPSEGQWAYNLGDQRFAFLSTDGFDYNLKPNKTDYIPLELADFRGDGDDDIAFVRKYDGCIVIFENRSNSGIYYWKGWMSAWAPPDEDWKYLKPSDIDGDGDADLIVYHPNGVYKVALNTQIQ